MIDELDLAFDESVSRGRPRHRRGKGGGGGKAAIAFLLSFVLLGALGGGVWYGFGKVRGFFTAADYSGPGTGEVIVEVKTGDSATAIGNTLYDAGVVKSAAAFIDAAKDNPKSKDIQVGPYKLRKQMKAAAALGMLLDLKNLFVTKVTLPEGLNYKQVYDKLSKATKIPVADFEKAGKNPQGLGVPSLWFKRTDGKKVNTQDIEGFLYPATYAFPGNADATKILEIIIQHFNSEMEELDFPNTVNNNLHISPYEALVAASIAQAEAVLDKDMGPVARVLYNRVYSKKFPCNCMQLDSTVNYYLRITGKGSKSSGQLTAAELNDPSDPYSTHVHPGMAIGPIGNPGEAALKGAMAPPKNNYFFFVTVNKQGAMAYATTDAQHEANKQVACRNGIDVCGS
jgi:UPF0755 protein